MKHRFIYTFVIVGIGLFLILSCENKSTKTGRQASQFRKATVRQEWFPNSNYAGIVYAKHKYAKKYDVELKIESGSENIDPIKMVLSGSNQFADASADMVLLANEKGANLVIIGVLNQISPTCFITRKESNITTPFEFIKRKVGILTGTSTENVYRVLLKKLGINRNKIIEVEVPFNLETFILGEYDVRPAFIYDEPITLDLKQIRYDLIEPHKYGVSYMGTVYFTTKKIIETEHDLVQDFINSVADGWTAAVRYPTSAIRFLKEEYPDIDETRELAAMKKSIPYFKDQKDRVLYFEKSNFEKMITELKDCKLIGDIEIEASINNSFISEYYEKRNKK